MRFLGPRPRWWISLVLILALLLELTFFLEQLHYIDRHGGVPRSLLGRHYAGVLEDVARAASLVDASEVWLDYGGTSEYQDEPAVYLFRRAKWGGTSPRRAVVHFAFWQATDAAVVEYLPEGANPPDGALPVRPWNGPRQVGAKVPLRPE